MSPARFGVPRGSLPRILTEAGEISDARMRSTLKYLDEFTAVEDPGKHLGGGGRLTRAQFAQLLQQNPDFQQAIANRWVFSTEAEKKALVKQLQGLFPGTVAPSVGGVPGTAIPPEQQGTGLGGPPQGAAPVGPQPVPGLAPPGASVPAPPSGGPGGPPIGPPGPGLPPGLPMPPGPGVPLAPPGGPPGPIPPGLIPVPPAGPLPVAPGMPPGLPPGPPLGPPFPAPPPLPAPPGAPAPSLAARLV
jgi:hypothetical protein